MNDDVDTNRYTEDEVVLITGSTGRLGSFLLEKLLCDKRVRKVFALNRGSPTSDKTLLDRQREMFKTLEINMSLLTSSKVEYLVADYAKPLLGLSEEKYDEVSWMTTT